MNYLIGLDLRRLRWDSETSFHFFILQLIASTIPYTFNFEAVVSGCIVTYDIVL